MRIVTCIILVCPILLFACTTYKSSTTSRNLNVSFLYNPGSTSVHPDYEVFNETANSSRIYIKLKTGELMFIDENENSYAKVRVKYILYNTMKNMAVCDSGTVIFHIKKPAIKNYVINPIEVAARDTFNYFLDLTVYDLNQEKGNQVFINIERSKKINFHDALFLDKSDEPFFGRVITENDTFKVLLRKGLPVLWSVSWFQNKFPLRPPPFSIGNYNRITIPKPDSTRLYVITDTTYFTLNNESIIQFYLDTLKYGFPLMNFGSAFPEITTSVSLLQPLRMLTTQKEFNDINILANKKEGVDKFWLDAGGNVSRARELIRVFYTRVMLANRYFTSYTEGWKTDRGLIYIVFGLPVTIYKAENVERWIYGTSQSNKTLVFNFTRQPNPFCTNDFVLTRDELYKISWTQAVDTWRNGKVFSVAY